MSIDDPHPDSLPDADTAVDSPPVEDRRDDDRSDIEQVVEARSDVLARGEGGEEPNSLTAPGEYAGTGGTGGVVKNQDLDAQ